MLEEVPERAKECQARPESVGELEASQREPASVQKCPRLPDCQRAKLPERAKMPDTRCQMPEGFHPEIFLRFLNKVFPEVFKRVMKKCQRVPES